MIKRTLSAESPTGRLESSWIDLEDKAEVEVTSEDPAHPIEAALLGGQSGGWQAAEAGKQTLRLVFPEPLPLKRVRLVFEEHRHARTQQFVLRVAEGGSGAWSEIVRQQFNFSPSGSTREEESYALAGVPIAALEVMINPDMAGGSARASIEELRVS